MAEKKDAISSRELKIITENASRNKEGAGYKFRVVQYIKDGKSIAVKLESGEYWTGEDGIVRFKAKGLSLRDVEELLKTDIERQKRVIQVIHELMKNPPPLDDSKPDAEPGAEEVPFS